MRDESTNFICFLTGASLGIAVGLLTAPGPGAETRKKLASQPGRDLLDRSRELINLGRRFADEAADMHEEGMRLFTEAGRTVQP